MKARRTGTVHHIVDARTASVYVDRQVRHPKYGKSYRRTTKLLVDVAPPLKLTVGAVVLIEATRPISKQKAWRVAEVVRVGSAAPMSLSTRLRSEATAGQASPSTTNSGSSDSGQSPEETV